MLASFGTRYVKYPNVNNLVADLSSNIMSEVIDVNKFNLIYAGAQKNVAPSGLTIVIVKKDLVDIQTNKAEDPFGWRILVERKY